MSLAGFVVRPLFGGFIAGGLEPIPSEIRHVVVNRQGGSIFNNESGIEYAVWPASQFSSLGAPDYKGNNGTTNALGEFVLSTSYSVGDKAILALRLPQGAAGGDDDAWAIGEVTAVAV